MRYCTRFLVLLSLWSLAACVSTPNYVDHTQTDTPMSQQAATDIHYKISPLYYRAALECVTVLPTESPHPIPLNERIANGFARYLGERFDQVIFPHKRNRRTQSKGMDLNNKQDRLYFARRFNCPVFARATLYDYGNDFMVIASKKQIGLKLELFRASDDEPLWQAAHTAWDGDGGLPLSPVGLATSVAQAALYAKNDEAVLALINTAIRRMIQTLPPAI